jgi:hypothetical protein
MFANNMIDDNANPWPVYYQKYANNLTILINLIFKGGSLVL